MEYQLNPVLLNRSVEVTVIGAGGSGSHMLTGLAQLDAAMKALGHPGGLTVTVYDGDTVSPANVGRQMFFPSDVGLNKATVLVNRINMAMGTNWDAEPRFWTRSHEYGGPDIIIGCVDTRAARAAIYKFNPNRKTLWLDLGNKLHDGQVILGELPTEHQSSKGFRLPTVADLCPDVIDETQDAHDDTPSCSLAEALRKQSLFINRGVSLYALNLLADLFRYGKLSYHGVFVNLHTGRTTPLNVDRKTWASFGYETNEQ